MSDNTPAFRIRVIYARKPDGKALYHTIGVLWPRSRDDGLRIDLRAGCAILPGDTQYFAFPWKDHQEQGDEEE